MVTTVNKWTRMTRTIVAELKIINAHPPSISWCMNSSNYRFIRHIHDMWHSSSILGIIIMGILNPINGYITIPFYGTCIFFGQQKTLQLGRVGSTTSVASRAAFAAEKRSLVTCFDEFSSLKKGWRADIFGFWYIYIYNQPEVYIYTFYVYIYIYLFDM